MLLQLLKYFEPLWSDSTGKINIKKVLAVALTVDFIMNVSFIIHRWDGNKSISDGAMLLGIEASLIGALLTLNYYNGGAPKPPSITPQE